MNSGTGVTPRDGVKSADRVLAILEHFRLSRHGCSARDIAEALNMPRSSTNVLLRSMIDSLYLRFDGSTNLYFPTLKVYQLGSWLVEGLFEDPLLDDVMHRLLELTQETVCLWVRIGVSGRIIKVLESPLPISLKMTPGMWCPFYQTAVGRAFLSLQDDDETRKEVDLYNKRAGADGRVDIERLVRDVRADRRRGVSVGYNLWLEDAGVVAKATGSSDFGDVVTIAVGGPTFRIRRNEAQISQSLLQAISQLNGAVLSS